MFWTPGFADGIIIPDPPICEPGPCPVPIPFEQLAIEYHEVDVIIEDQVAITRVDQVFRNDNEWVVEGTYVFPIPKGAVVNEFSLWMNGEPVQGKILTKEEARQIYEDIVRSLRDPALLEYIGQGAVQASIFPIQPGETSRIELEYSQVLEPDNGLFHYRYPLNTEKFSTLPLETVIVNVEVHSDIPVHGIYSSSHPIAIERLNNYTFKVGYEASKVKPDLDFDLYYSVSSDDLGVNLLSYRDPYSEDPSGYFLLLAAPTVEIDQVNVIPKDVMIVLDQSGSMEGEKIGQALDAVHFILDHLNSRDRFNLISFSTAVNSFRSTMQDTDAIPEAHDWLDRLSAQGSTDINRALLDALSLSDTDRPTILIFLTDGLPTYGLTDTDAILDNIGRNMTDNIRLFSFGVGYDVDTFLLDSLSDGLHGATTYVQPGQAIDEIVSGFYAKVTSPVLADIELDIDGAITYDLHPSPLPDLFAGGQLLVVGRYREPGELTITVTGTVNGFEQEYRYSDESFTRSGGPDFLPRLWATRKIGDLLKQVRLHGPDQELVDQIVRLSIRYGIVTPYTSFLVTEPDALGSEAQEEIAQEAYSDMAAAPNEVTGQAAVERAADEGEYSHSEIAAVPAVEAMDTLQITGSRAFVFKEGIWIETAFDPDTMTTLRVPYLSEMYFDLLEARPDLGPAFALGNRVIALSAGQAYEVVGMDDVGDEFELPYPNDSVGDGPEQDPILSDPEEWVEHPSRSFPCFSFVGFGILLFPPLFFRRFGRS
jgi:Ca-activated chloride channel family protein